MGVTEPRRSEVPSPTRERVRERVKPRRPHAASAAPTSRQRPKRPRDTLNKSGVLWHSNMPYTKQRCLG